LAELYKTGRAGLGGFATGIGIKEKSLLKKLDMRMLEPVREHATAALRQQCMKLDALSISGGYNSLRPLFENCCSDRPNHQTQN
jgi:hypothetical protein